MGIKPVFTLSAIPTFSCRGDSVHGSPYFCRLLPVISSGSLTSQAVSLLQERRRIRSLQRVGVSSPLISDEASSKRVSAMTLSAPRS